MLSADEASTDPEKVGEDDVDVDDGDDDDEEEDADFDVLGDAVDEDDEELGLYIHTAISRKLDDGCVGCWKQARQKSVMTKQTVHGK